MNKKVLLIVLVTTLLILPVIYAANRPYTGTPTRDGDLASNLSLLNLWGEQPPPVQQVYTAAYSVLASDPMARFADVALDDAFQALRDAHDIKLLGGPMLGSILADGARVWLRTAAPAAVEVHVLDGPETRSFGPVQSTLENDLTVIVPVTGLAPDTQYAYRVLVDGSAAPIPDDATIHTAPSEDAAGTVRIAFGSCTHRWGLGNMMQAEAILARRPSAMLLPGDIAVQDRNNHIGLHRADYLLRDMMPAWQRLAASVPVYVTWDDHDYFDNDLAGIPDGFTAADRANVRQVWIENWNNPAYGFDDERGGVFLHTRIGPADIIMVDNRYFREKGAYLGEAQQRWVKEQLLQCEAPFIILSCGTMWSDYVSDGKDSWGVYDPAGREALFSFIEEHRIDGVLLISGDRHGARGFAIPRSDAFSFYEFGAASLGGRRGPPVTKRSWDTQLYGFEDVYAFGEFEFDVDGDEPEVTFRLIQSDGEILYDITLQRNTLTPGP